MPGFTDLEETLTADSTEPEESRILQIRSTDQSQGSNWYIPELDRKTGRYWITNIRTGERIATFDHPRTVKWTLSREYALTPEEQPKKKDFDSWADEAQEEEKSPPTLWERVHYWLQEHVWALLEKDEERC